MSHCVETSIVRKNTLSTLSKELLSVLLGIECTPYKIESYGAKGDKNYIRVQNNATHKCNGYGNEISINIYELACKCKQKYPEVDLNLVATDIDEFWQKMNILAEGGNK
jgi:hypothetical protein